MALCLTSKHWVGRSRFQSTVILKPCCTLRRTEAGIEGLTQPYRQSIEAMPYDLLQGGMMTSY
jgi:hypothetical protein